MMEFGQFGPDFLPFGPFRSLRPPEIPASSFYSRSCHLYLPVPRSLPGALDSSVSFLIAVPFGFGKLLSDSLLYYRVLSNKVSSIIQIILHRFP